MNNILKLFGRDHFLFTNDINYFEKDLLDIIQNSKFLVIGAAGSIGQAVTKEIFKRNPRVLYAVDINENNLVELVRDIRSSLGYIQGEFKTYTIDSGGIEFEALINEEKNFDYILNLSALKHVRNEKDPYTLMRMINVNIFNAIKNIKMARACNSKNYFSVSTDKASNPVNMMGASKKIMEMILMRESKLQHVTSARFANVAFSDGSLLYGFNQRMIKRQPITVPLDIRRYFITAGESGELCLLSTLLGNNREIFFPKLDSKFDLIDLTVILDKFLRNMGFEVFECSGEEEARERIDELIPKKKWPCYFFKSDTTGEKEFEEFYTDSENIDLLRFQKIGVIKNEPMFDATAIENFINGINSLLLKKTWNRADILMLIRGVLPNFQHEERGKFLEQRM